MVDIFEDTIGEIEAVVKDTESSANEIFDATESIVTEISGIKDEKLRSSITENVARIFEACHFQDFAGQRATKIISNLNEIRSKTGAIEKQTVSEEGDLKQGPQTTSTNQSKVDKMFEGSLTE